LKLFPRSVAAAILAVAVSVASAAATVPAKSTEILWDRYGIPHIFAPDRPSLFYAYGYAQMETHSELLVRLYTQARGRGAELYGEEFLNSARWVRVNGLPELARKWATEQSPEFAPMLAAFVDGLNAWGKEHSESLSVAAKAALPLKVGKTFARTTRPTSGCG
jgi:acyl-homoserine-lactone acylase